MMKASIRTTAAEAKTALALQLHGKTKIELFDAANGAKVYEQIDENKMALYFLNSFCNGTITALLLQTFQTSQYPDSKN